jgi:hypothetical protein
MRSTRVSRREVSVFQIRPRGEVEEEAWGMALLYHEARSPAN